VGRAGWIVGGSFGRGKVFEGGQPIGWADVTQLSVGLQGGAQSVRQVLIFVTQERMDAFKRGGSFTLSADVSAVALTAGAAATTNPSSGVIAIVQTRGGLMAQAAIGGERLRFTPNAGAAASARTPT
jgi:lipid-binding SYLF domain-containing protein